MGLTEKQFYIDKTSRTDPITYLLTYFTRLKLSMGPIWGLVPV